MKKINRCQSLVREAFAGNTIIQNDLIRISKEDYEKMETSFPKAVSVRIDGNFSLAEQLQQLANTVCEEVHFTIKTFILSIEYGTDEPLDIEEVNSVHNFMYAYQTGNIEGIYNVGENSALPCQRAVEIFLFGI